MAGRDAGCEIAEWHRRVFGFGEAFEPGTNGPPSRSATSNTTGCLWPPAEGDTGELGRPTGVVLGQAARTGCGQL
jgi:hypothetical protein